MLRWLLPGRRGAWRRPEHRRTPLVALLALAVLCAGTSLTAMPLAGRPGAGPTPLLAAAPLATRGPALTLALVGTGRIGPGAVTPFLLAAQAAPGDVIAAVEISASGADDRWQRLATPTAIESVTLLGGFDPTRADIGGSPAPGERRLLARVTDGRGNRSAAALVVAYDPVFPSFADVLPAHPEAEAIRQLAARGIVRGYADGRFGPADRVERAQVAALIARALGWGGEEWDNAFVDRDGLVLDLWQAVGTLAHYGVAYGYDGVRFAPTDPVTRAQAISFIARAMVARGLWQRRDADPGLYPNVPPATGHVADLATFVHYVGAVPGSVVGEPWGGWSEPAERAWVATTLWAAVGWLEDSRRRGDIPAPPYPILPQGLAIVAEASNRSPQVGETVTVAADLARGGRPLASVPVEAVALGGSGSASCAGTSAGDGRAICQLTIAADLAGGTVVDATVRDSGVALAARVVLDVLRSAPAAPTPTATTSPLPGGANRSLPVGAGFSDVSPHQLVRTSGGVLYAIVPTCDSYPSCPGATLRVYRADRPGTPVNFTERAAANRPAGVGTSAIAIDGQDRLHALWLDRAGRAVYAVFDTAADRWGAQEIVAATGWTTFGQGDQGAALALDAAGVPHAAWTAREADGRLHIHYAGRPAGGWTAPTRADDAPLAPNHHAWHPTIAFAPDGALLLAWLDGSFNYTPDGAIRTRTRAASGAWAPSTTLPGAAMTGIDNGPSLLITPDGARHLAFLDTGNAIRYWYDAGQGWRGDRQPPRQVTHNPSLGPDGAGGVYLYGHGTPQGGLDGHGDNLYRLRLPAGSAAWGPWTLYAAGSFDSSVSTRWAQFFHHFPGTVDILYWADPYPNVLYLGTE